MYIISRSATSNKINTKQHTQQIGGYRSAHESSHKKPATKTLNGINVLFHVENWAILTLIHATSSVCVIITYEWSNGHWAAPGVVLCY